MYIDGKWVESSSGATTRLPNPATEEIVASAPDASRDDLRRAIGAARRAFDHGPWRKTTPDDRSKILLRLADGIERRKEEFRDLLVRAHAAEHLTHPIQLDMPVELLRTYAELVVRFPFDEPLPTPGGPAEIRSLAVHQPVGVCGLIPTWNFPLYTTVQKLGPALATGCSVVVKPSPWGPLVDLLVAELIEECDVPAGVYNVVTGESPELGRELAESPEIDKISFTGSAETGKAVMRAAAKTLKRVHLELGGKSASIILDDYDLDAAAPGAASPTFFHAGQGCAITTRVLVQRRRHDALVEKMVGFVRGTVVVGDPADPSVLLGPLIREERRRAVERYIELGRKEGAELVTGGGRPAGLDAGWFLEPTIFANVTNEMRIAREEIFGPVVSVIPFDDEDDAVRIANDSSYGLYGGIMTGDTARGLELARRIRTGGVSINNAANLPYAPFGGFKESGIGREGGIFGLREFTEVQALAWPG